MVFHFQRGLALGDHQQRQPRSQRPSAALGGGRHGGHRSNQAPKNGEMRPRPPKNATPGGPHGGEKPNSWGKQTASPEIQWIWPSGYLT